MTMTAIRRIWAIITDSERREAKWLMTALCVAALAELASVAAIYPFLAVVADPSAALADARIRWLQDLIAGDERAFVVRLGMGVFALTIIANALVAFTIWWQVRFAWRVNHTLSRRLLERHLSRPYADFVSTNSSAYARQVLAETQTVIVNTLDPVFTLVGRLAASALITALLVAVSPVVTVIFLVVIGGAYGAFFLKLRRRLKASGEAALAADQARFRTVADALGAIKQVKVGGLERHFSGRYAPYSLAFSGHQTSLYVARRIPYYVMQTVAFGGLTLMLVVLVALGYELAEILPLVGILAVGGFRLLPSFQQIIAAAVALRFTQPLIDALHAELTGGAPAGPPRAPATWAPEREIALDGVWVTHRGALEPTLEDVSVVIPARSSAAFVGATGGGKSTLIDVLLGLLTPSRGRVLIDGRAVTPEALPSWQRAVGYVPQEIAFIDDSISANIAFGVAPERVDLARVREVARVAHVHEFIEALPDGYGTRVGERGVRLSGGERQRLGIARALYHDPPVLVMDEATSDIDNKTEAEIARTLAGLTGRKTVLVVAHRLATARTSDMIHVMHRGRVVASGRYDELLERDARFRELALAGERSG